MYMNTMGLLIRSSLLMGLLAVGFPCLAQRAVFDSASVHRGVVPDVKTTPYKGTLITAIGWKDGNGSNVLIFSTKEAYIINSDEELRRAEFYVCCYVTEKAEPRLLWEIQDKVDSCWCDCEVALKENTIQIRDLDGDGVAENLFIYLLNDRCDASPVKTKLMMHSGEVQMGIQGYSEQFLGPSEAETNRFRQELGLKPLVFKEVDAIFDKFPSVFANYASQYWDLYIETENRKFNEEHKD